MTENKADSAPESTGLTREKRDSDGIAERIPGENPAVPDADAAIRAAAEIVADGDADGFTPKFYESVISKHVGPVITELRNHLVAVRAIAGLRAERIADLERQLADARADTERLDDLIHGDVRTIVLDDAAINTPMYDFEQWIIRDETGAELGRDTDLRKAIDAAREKGCDFREGRDSANAEKGATP